MQVKFALANGITAKPKPEAKRGVSIVAEPARQRSSIAKEIW